MNGCQTRNPGRKGRASRWDMASPWAQAPRDLDGQVHCGTGATAVARARCVGTLEHARSDGGRRLGQGS
ncbi:hypothetical protein NL676_002082 [Syzygium grande]|nr:hypothetical protein NL676_002082 [Syzygium grande]